MTKSLDKVLSNGCGTVLVVLASWCGACKRALPMWLTQLKKKKNEKNVVLLDNELLANTSLNGSLNITHFPSTFEIPAGGSPTLLENPQNLESMEKLVNSSSSTSASRSAEAEAEAEEKTPSPTVISAAEYVKRNNGPDSFESLNTEERTENKKVSFPNTLSQSTFMTPKGFTPSMNNTMPKKGGRRSRTRRIRRNRVRGSRAIRRSRRI